jgi:hypothetical protein
MHGDGTKAMMLDKHLGGHPEWAPRHRLLGNLGEEQLLFDVDTQQTTATLGDSTIFPDPNGDKALSPAGDWLVNGYRVKGQNFYVFYRLADGTHARSEGFDQHGWTSGELRVDPAPCWNRDGTRILVPSIDRDGKTRQLFVAELDL